MAQQHEAMRSVELGTFLRACRAAMSPAAAGLADSGRRRVPGLRREEVATLVGLSTDYYVRLEQGRGGRPSEPVLEALTRVLQLDETQRQHLRHLAHPPRRHGPAAGTARERMTASTRMFLNTLTVPALVLTRSTQVIGWNDLARALFTDFSALPERERYTAWLLFLNEELAARHRDWERSARETVGMLRMTAGQNPNHTELSELVHDLAIRSAAFRALWAEHHVHEKASGLNRLRHPEVGEVDLNYTTWTTPDSPEQMLITYTPEPASPSAHALELLGVQRRTR